MPDSHPPENLPRWLWQARRLFPHPVFAGCVSVAFLLVTVIFAGVAVGERIWAMGVGSLIFLCATYATAAAAVSLARERRAPSSMERERGASKAGTPTYAVLVLLIGIYSWMLTLAIHVFHAFFKNGPGSMKYYVTLGIAVASTVYMRIHGKRVIEQHLGAMGGRNLELSARQALFVFVFVVSCSMYLLWVVS